jgi:hypothetical protein
VRERAEYGVEVLELGQAARVVGHAPSWTRW